MLNTPQIAKSLRKFAAERDWNQFHTPKNLATSIVIESAELLELFQWSRGQSDWGDLADEKFKNRASEELADILIYAIRFADLAGIDLEQAILEKIEQNTSKYPIEKVRGSDKKYNEH
jgi:NTP pyrophosphatase (non-canonical NTP hydrolase)